MRTHKAILDHEAPGALPKRWGLLAGLALGALFAGCGEGPEPPGERGQVTAPATGAGTAPGDEADPAAASAHAPGAGAVTSAKPGPRERAGEAPEAAGGGAAPREPGGGQAAEAEHAAEAGETEPIEAAYAELMRRVEPLEEAMRFAEAMRLMREFQAEHGAAAHAFPIDRRIAALRRDARRMPQLSYALERIGPSVPWEVREVAHRKLFEAGALGRSLLLGVVREAQEAGRVEAAAELLARQGAWEAIPPMLRRAVEAPEAPAADGLLEAARSLMDAVPEEARPAMAGRFIRLYDHVREDADFRRRRMAGTLLALGHRWFEGDFAALGAFLGRPEAPIYLEAYAGVARRSEDSAIARWGLKTLLALGETRPSLAGWWSFDELDAGAADVPDRSGQARHGALEGARPVRGRYGGALRFEGQGGFVRIGDAAPWRGGAGSELTVSVVFKTEAPKTFSPLVEKQWSGQDGDWGLSVSGGGLGYYSEDGGNDYHAKGGRVEAGRWHHAVMCMRQGEARFELTLYLDGEQVARRSETGRISAATRGDVFIGARKYENRQEKGRAKAVIDDVRIYERWMEASAVRALDPGGYVKPEMGAAGPEVAGALLEALEGGAPPARAAILHTALRGIWDRAGAEVREAYRPVIHRLLKLAQSEEAGEAWQETEAKLLVAWFDGDKAALEAWLEGEGSAQG